MRWVRNLLIAVGVFAAGPAFAEVGCVPNPNLTPLPFVDGCPLPVAGLNYAFTQFALLVTGNTALRLLPITARAMILRMDYEIGFGAKPQLFSANAAVCPTIDDGGSCVTASGGGSWRAQFVGGLIPTSEFGVAYDGTTAADTQFQRADAYAASVGARLELDGGPIKLVSSYAMLSTLGDSDGKGMIKPVAAAQITLPAAPAIKAWATQVFDVSAATIINPIIIDLPNLTEYPEWFGPVGQGNDDAAAINAALNAPTHNFTLKMQKIYNVCSSPAWLPRTGTHAIVIDLNATWFANLGSGGGTLQVKSGCATGIVAALYNTSRSVRITLRGGTISGNLVAPHAVMFAQANFASVDDITITGAKGVPGTALTLAIPNFYSAPTHLGTGYLVGDVLNLVGLTCTTQAAQLLVTHVDSNDTFNPLAAGQIRAVQVFRAGIGCSVLPAQGVPIAVSGGTGAGGQVIVAFGSSQFAWPAVPGTGYTVGETCTIDTSNMGVTINGVDAVGGVTAMSVSTQATTLPTSPKQIRALTSCSAGGTGAYALADLFPTAAATWGNAWFIDTSTPGNPTASAASVEVGNSARFNENEVTVFSQLPAFAEERYTRDSRNSGYQAVGGFIAGVCMCDSGGDTFFGVHPFPGGYGGGVTLQPQMFGVWDVGTNKIYGAQFDTSAIAGALLDGIGTVTPIAMIGNYSSVSRPGDIPEAPSGAMASIIITDGYPLGIVQGNVINNATVASPFAVGFQHVLQMGGPGTRFIVNNNQPNNDALTPSVIQEPTGNTISWVNGNAVRDIPFFYSLVYGGETNTWYLPKLPVTPPPGTTIEFVYGTSTGGLTMTLSPAAGATINGGGAIALTVPWTSKKCTLDASGLNWFCR